MPPDGDQPAAKPLAGTRVLVCLTGSVAGVKAGELLSALLAAGAECRAVTSAAGAVFLVRSQQRLPDSVEVLQDGNTDKALDDDACAGLAQWPHLLLFAPASANSLAALALGLCPHAPARVARCWPAAARPLLLAPAMNTAMWAHPATAAHLEVLRGRGAHIIAPVSKLLACGDLGVGAMAAVADIVAATVEAWAAQQHALQANKGPAART